MPHALIVDDESGIRFALKRWFERQHWTVSETGDGVEALALLRASTEQGAGRYDVVVCDLHLPGMAGEEIIQHLMIERTELVKRIILTTGDTTTDAPEGSIVANHPYVLQKPFDLATLRLHVELICPPTA